jgi:hypothetical protein
VVAVAKASHKPVWRRWLGGQHGSWAQRRCGPNSGGSSRGGTDVYPAMIEVIGEAVAWTQRCQGAHGKIW